MEALDGSDRSGNSSPTKMFEVRPESRSKIRKLTIKSPMNKPSSPKAVSFNDEANFKMN